MEDDEQQVLVDAEMHQPGTQQDVAAEVKPPSRQFAQEVVGLGAGLGGRQRPKIGHRQLELPRVEDLLNGDAVAQVEPRAKNLMPAHNGLQRASEARGVEVGPDPYERGHVVRAQTRHHPVEEEEPLLGKGQPARAGALVPCDGVPFSVIRHRRLLGQPWGGSATSGRSASGTWRKSMPVSSNRRSLWGMKYSSSRARVSGAMGS